MFVYNNFLETNTQYFGAILTDTPARSLSAHLKICRKLVCLYIFLHPFDEYICAYKYLRNLIWNFGLSIKKIYANAFT
jgi:hypothetical protein